MRSLPRGVVKRTPLPKVVGLYACFGKVSVRVREEEEYQASIGPYTKLTCTTYDLKGYVQYNNSHAE